MATEFKLSYTANEINTKLGKIDSLAEKSELPTKTSDLTNDSGYIVSSDIVNNLTTNVTNKPLSAAQGVAIKSLIDNKLDSSTLGDAVDDALAQAKASGEFDGTSVTHSWSGTTLTVTSASGTSSADLKGAKGDSPVRGTDYWTEADKNEIKAYVDDAILNGAW